jgi:starch synthase (maltosyl-transferring)
LIAMRIYYISPSSRSPEAATDNGSVARHWKPLICTAAELGFNTVMAPWPPMLTETDTAARARSSADERTVPDALDAAHLCAELGLAFVMDLLVEDMVEGAVEQVAERLAKWCAAGVSGYCCRDLQSLSAADWTRLIQSVHQHYPGCVFMAWTPGLTPLQLKNLRACGFRYTFNSLPWWDYRSGWLVQEQERLSRIAPAISPMSDIARPGSKQQFNTQDSAQAQRLLWAAAVIGDGLLMPQGMEQLAGKQAVERANHWQASHADAGGSLRLLTGPLSSVTAVFRPGEKAAVLALNTDTHAAVAVSRALLASRLPNSYVLDASVPDVLEEAGHCLIPVKVAKPVKAVVRNSPAKATPPSPLTEARIAIERVSPQVDGGRFPAKRCLGQSVRVEADVFMDGHSHLAVSLLWRAADKTAWRRVAMQALGNDRWRAEFAPERLGRHCYTVQAWHDSWASHCEALKKKYDAGQNVSLEVEEARVLLDEALKQIQSDQPEEATELKTILREIGQPQRTGRKAGRGPSQSGHADQSSRTKPVPPVDSKHIDLVLSETTANRMRAANMRSFELTDLIYPLTVERREAGYASWYELFPRSQSATPGVHGTFKDVEARLPFIQEMGFDVLYMPPIHPIGLTNRKGRNNSLSASKDDPGSPYAIGSAQGGHDALHPELGSMSDFQDLMRAAQRHGLEIAMDFAIQCSPDHPWLGLHPEWFDWRADGSLRYAENPPKRYEDIVNPDFYLGGDALWRALRDVILFWVDQGVRLFRVDNPHTKPLPFWHWLITEVQDAHADVVFLSEAFTRPKMMYRLAKVGFSQSYTYFTWRHGKQELIDYLTELSSPPAADFFRPHFFVNTPDINPYFLQTSGRPGFLIRAALATTTSGLWGMYNGFELCEARSIGGKEEYQDSEKYEPRSWDWDRPGNIIDEITRLNRIRRLNPALQTHLGIGFHPVDNDQILFFTKATPEGDNVVLVAICLDPHARQGGTLELPVGQWPWTGDRLQMEDLFEEGRFELRGNRHYIELTPERPFLIWRLLPAA